MDKIVWVVWNTCIIRILNTVFVFVISNINSLILNKIFIMLRDLRFMISYPFRLSSMAINIGEYFWSTFLISLIALQIMCVEIPGPSSSRCIGFSFVTVLYIDKQSPKSAAAFLVDFNSFFIARVIP